MKVLILNLSFIMMTASAMGQGQIISGDAITSPEVTVEDLEVFVVSRLFAVDPHKSSTPRLKSAVLITLGEGSPQDIHLDQRNPRPLFEDLRDLYAVNMGWLPYARFKIAVRKTASHCRSKSCPGPYSKIVYRIIGDPVEVMSLRAE